MTNCPNCGVPLQGFYCQNCGQDQKDIKRFFLELFNEAFEDVFSPGSRTSRTLFNLTFRPGFLTNEYSLGRRMRYLPPLRLYLITSFFFFLLLSMTTSMDGDGQPTDAESLPEDIIVNVHDEGISVADGSITDSSIIDGSTTDGQEEELNEEEFQRDLDEAVAGFDVSFLEPETNQRVRELLKNQATKAEKLIREDPRGLFEVFLDLIPPIMFVLLPIFAVLLKLTYISSGRYYAEHLILSLHNHSFIFFILLVSRLFEAGTDLPVLGFVADALDVGINIWIPLYLYLSLKNCYAEGTAITIFKYCLLSFFYIILLSLMVPVAMLWGLLTL